MMHQGVVHEVLEKYKMTKEQYDAISQSPSLNSLEAYGKLINGCFEEQLVYLLPGHVLLAEIYVRSVTAGKDPKVTA
jgi:hypothetical protein